MLRSLFAVSFAIGIVAMSTQASHASSAEKARVASAVAAVAVYADNRDFSALERFFAPETVIDYTSLWGGEPQRFSPEALMAAWSGLLPGFDATRHELTAIAVTLSGGTATARADVRATHWIGGRQWIVAGSYDYRLTRTAEGWQVARMTFRLEEESGDRGLVEEAAARARGG